MHAKMHKHKHACMLSDTHAGSRGMKLPMVTQSTVAKFMTSIQSITSHYFVKIFPANQMSRSVAI